MGKFLSQVNQILSEARVKRDKNGLFVYEGGLSGVKRYYKDPECMILHREDGPAVEYSFNNAANKYYLDGKQYPYSKWLILSKFQDIENKPSSEEVSKLSDILDL